MRTAKYMASLLSFLIVLLFIILLFIPSQAAAQSQETIEWQIFEMVNQERTSIGLPAYTMDSKLRQMARDHSKDMGDNLFYSHTSPNTGTFSQRISAAGLSGASGENIHRFPWGSAQTAMYGGSRVTNGVTWTVQGWRDSHPHWEAIRSSTYKYIGIGVYPASDGNYLYTQLFNGALSPPGTILQPPTLTSYTLTVGSTNPTIGVAISSSTGHGGTTSYVRSIAENTSVSLTTPQYVGSGASRKSFSNWSGAVSSTDRTISVAMSANLNITAHYVDDPEKGSLKVTIDPAGVRNSGAQWKLTSGPDQNWKDSDGTINNLPVGHYTIVFKDITNWHKPADTSISITANTTVTRKLTYTPHTGAIRVNIEPSAVRSAGARWKLTSGPDQNWKSSGTTISNLLLGNYTVTFNEISRWSKPPDIQLTVTKDQTVSHSTTYGQLPAVPSLLSPANGSSVPGETIEFRWNAAARASSYELEILKVSDSTTVRQTVGNVTTASQGGFPDLLEAEQYRWRVKAINATGEGAWSAYRNFTSLAVPAAPLLVSPEADTVLAGTTIKFNWEAAAGATKYQLQVTRVSDGRIFKNATLGNVLTSSQSRFPNNGTEYRWQLRAGNASGWGEWSEVRGVTNSKIYSLRVNSTNPDSGIEVASSTGHGGDTSYELILANNTTVTLIAPEYQGSGESRKRFINWVGSVNSSYHSISLTMTANRTVTANYADDPELNSDASLLALEIDPGGLNPVFNAGIIAYTIDVDYEVDSVNIIATLSDANASLIINGTTATSGEAESVNLGEEGTSTPVSISVVAADGETENIYTITINRAVFMPTLTVDEDKMVTANYADDPEMNSNSNAELISLVLDHGEIDPEFDPAKINYTLALANDVDIIELTATLSDADASMTINGESALSGEAVTIALDEQGTTKVINIIVTAKDGQSAKTYTITVSKETEILGDSQSIGNQ